MTDSTMVVLGASSLALVVVMYVWFALALAAVFRKTGEPVWKAWVPIVNVATVLKLGGFSPWFVLINLVPLFGTLTFVILFIIAVHRITVGFGAGAGMTVVGAIFPVVWASILGFGSARWEGDAPRGPDEQSAPVRRGQDFQGPYVPLVGGWTPAPESRSGDGSRDAEEHAPDAADTPVEPAPVSEPVIVPFAAPTGSLADAVPASGGWGPPPGLRPAEFDDRRRPTPAVSDEQIAPAERPAVAAASGSSVFEVLDALRDGADDDAPSRRSTPAAADDDASSRSAARAVPPAADDDASTRALVIPGAPSSWTPAPVEPAPPAVDEQSDPIAPWATPARRTTHSDAAAPIAEVPLTRPAPEPVPAPRASAPAPADEFPELSEAVSAVPDAPDAGSPRSARTSVSSLYTRPEVPAVASDDDDFDALDRTVVTKRKRIPWALVPPSGAPIDLTSTVVILGRRPAADNAFPDAQLVSIADETRTVSKTHARLQLRGETWFVTDLDSTNGVLFATLMGTEVEAPPGEEIEAGERFFLGDAEVRLARSSA